MADTPTPPPTPPRRKAATAPRKATRTSKPKAPAAIEETAATPAPKVKQVAPRKAPARKAAPPKSASPVTRARAATKSAATKVGKVAGGATAKVSERASSARKSVAQSAPVKVVSDTRERMGDRNFFAAVIGGVAALGAAAGGIFYALRNGNPNAPGKKAADPKPEPEQPGDEG